MDKRNCLLLLLPNFISIDKSKYRHQLFLKYLKLVSIGCYPTLFSGPGPFNCEMPKLLSLWKAVCDIIHKLGKSCTRHHKDTRIYYSESPTMVVGFDSGTKHIDSQMSHFFFCFYLFLPASSSCFFLFLWVSSSFVRFSMFFIQFFSSVFSRFFPFHLVFPVSSSSFFRFNSRSSALIALALFSLLYTP